MCSIKLVANRNIECGGLVGVNNHRQFLLFVLTLVIGIVLFDYLTYACKFAWTVDQR